MKYPHGIQSKLQQRKEKKSLRSLSVNAEGIDFYSNDYLGLAKSKTIYTEAIQLLKKKNLEVNSATGSRLISGNTHFHEEVEAQIAKFHQAETALLFNSGYDANVGFFSSVPQRGDVVFYDELIHASIRDGLQMSLAKTYKFKHNNLNELKRKVDKLTTSGDIFIVTESVFSMDGDTPDLEKLVNYCSRRNVFLIVDEAHALGVFGSSGEGVIQAQNLQDKVFARIMTFGKGLGAHGAAVIGNAQLKEFLINFARSFMYTTAISPQAVATISSAYQVLESSSAKEKLQQNIHYFQQQVEEFQLTSRFIKSKSAIQSCLIPGNEEVKNIAEALQQQEFMVKPILSPTVPEGEERLRFCLHSYNSKEEIFKVLQLLATFVGE